MLIWFSLSKKVCVFCSVVFSKPIYPGTCPQQDWQKMQEHSKVPYLQNKPQNYNNKKVFKLKSLSHIVLSEPLIQRVRKVDSIHNGNAIRRKGQFPPYQECLMNLGSISARKSTCKCTLDVHTWSRNYSLNTKILFLAKWWTVCNWSEECDHIFGYLRCLLKHRDLTDHRVQFR